MVTAAAAATLHIDLDLVVPVFLTAPDEPQDVTADHGEDKFRAKERGDFGAGCALGEQDGQGFVRGGEKDCHERGRGQEAVAKQGGCGGREAALWDETGQSAHHRPEFGRFFQKRRGRAQSVFDPVEQRVDDQQDRDGLHDIRQRVFQRVCKGV